jgi:nitrous oxide reductase
MSDKTETPRSDRRTFMKGVAAAGGVAAAAGGAAVAGGSAEDTPKAAAQDPAESKGYRETAHVREYYRLAQF